MQRHLQRVVTGAVLPGVVAWLRIAQAAPEPGVLLLNDFEADLRGWRFVGGEEFPGAKGALERAAGVAVLTADFSGGGAYVGGWRDLSDLGVRDIGELRFRVKADGVARFGVRINDGTGQCHQRKGVSLAATDGWQFVIEGMADDFHRYGVMVDEDFTVFYFDGVELRRTKTPAEARVPLYLLVDLALGGGWPIAETPNPSYMYVDYVRAWAKSR